MQTVSEFVAQNDMFREMPSDETMFLCNLFEENQKTSSGISGVLKRYAEECRKIDTDTGSLFGEEDPTAIEKLRSAYDHYATDLAENAENIKFAEGDFREPTDAEIQEARKQKAEVKAKWTNPDGTMKKGYHCAPNGKESKLSEEQWLQVRTPNFKKWFGDWETLAEAYPENEIFDIDEAYKFARKNLQGGSFTSKDGYGATLGREGIDKMNSGLARGKTANNRLHALAFANIGKLFGNSELLETEPPRDGNTNIKRYLKFYAPLYMDGLYAVKITVKELSGNNGNRLYSIEGLDITKESEYRGQSRGSKENSIPADYSDSVNNFVKKLREVKGNVSQVVDENGEPLVVYHGTESDFYEFKHGKAIGSGDKFGYLGEAFYATNDESVAETYGDRVIPIFLNLKNPYTVDNPAFTSPHSAGSFAKSLNVSPDKVSDLLKSQGYDGVIAKDEDMGYVEYAVYNSNRIKSATDNVGTYSENPDIRWSIREDSDAEKIDTQFSELYERYKNGDKAAYEEAAKLVADYAESKGYDVKVYHGTGADGFNVADASGKHFKNGEGMQAHGMGLYLATKRSTADKYRENADRPFVYTVKGIDATKLGFDDSSFDEDSLYELFWHAKTNGFDASIAETEKKISSRKEYIEEAKKSNLEGVSDLENALKNEEVRLKAFKQLKRIFNERGYTEADIDWHCKDGKVFDWFTNLKPNEVIDENKPLSEQPEIWKKFKNAWIDMWAYVKRKRKGKRYWESLNPDRLGKDGKRTAGFIFSRWSDEYGSAETINLLLRNGIYGIVYDGGLDGRCYVSFEGGAVVKLQDPFTFDDNGELIPLSKRFDEANPDMRWRDVEETPNLFERLKGVQGESTIEEKLKESDDLKYYFDYFKKNLLGKEIQTPIGKFAHFNLGHFNKLIARGENKGESEAVSSLKEWTDKIGNHGVDLGKNPPKGFDYARACNMPLVVDVLQNPQFVLVDTDDTLLFVKKYGEKTYFWCSVMNNGETLGIKSWRPLRLTKRKCEQLKVVYTKENGVVNLAQPRESQRNLDSTNFSENQEKNSRLRFLLRQERTENPVIWASIVLAREILLKRKITAAKLDRVLPADKFDGTKRSYALERAQRIAEKTKATQEDYKDRLNEAVCLAECDVYWNQDVMEEMYRSFRKDGEEYGIVRQRLLNWLKSERRRDLEKVKGLTSDEMGIDVADAIENALEAEPERKPAEEKPSDETEEETETSTSEGVDDEILGTKEKLAPSKIREIISRVRVGVTKAAKQAGQDEDTRRRVYRNTLVNVLTEATKRLTYGKEREAIMKKLLSLSQKGYAVIKIKDGERAGQKIDNYIKQNRRELEIATTSSRRGEVQDKSLQLY